MYLNSGVRLLTQVQDYVETLRNLNEDYLNIVPQDAHISPLGNCFLSKNRYESNCFCSLHSAAYNFRNLDMSRHIFGKTIHPIESQVSITFIFSVKKCAVLSTIMRLKPSSGLLTTLSPTKDSAQVFLLVKTSDSNL